MCVFDLAKAVFDALGDFDFALSGEQFDRAHLTHVHAYRIRRSTELGIDTGQSSFRLFSGVLVVI